MYFDVQGGNKPDDKPDDSSSKDPGDDGGKDPDDNEQKPGDNEPSSQPAAKGGTRPTPTSAANKSATTKLASTGDNTPLALAPILAVLGVSLVVASVSYRRL